MRDVIVSVGTSLLTNEDRGLAQKRPWQGWHHGDPLPPADSGIMFLQSLQSLSRGSAETNTLEHLPLQQGDHIHWLHSDTPQCQFCAATLCGHYNAVGFQGMMHSVAGMGFHENVFAEMGLRSLVTVAFDIIEQAERRGAHVEICATGGFKAELAYLNLIGILTGYRVLYMHEMFRELVSLPSLPISWQFDVVEENLGFFEWIDEEPRRASDVESRLKSLPELNMLIIYHEGYGFLSPAGEVLLRAYKQRCGFYASTWPPSSGRAPHEKDKTSGKQHHWPSGFERYFQNLLALNWISQVTYFDGTPAVSESPVAAVYSPDDGKLRVNYSSNFGITLMVETTARGQSQCELLVDYLNRRGKKL